MDNYESEEEYTDAMYQQDIQDAQMEAEEVAGNEATTKAENN